MHCNNEAGELRSSSAYQGVLGAEDQLGSGV